LSGGTEEGAAIKIRKNPLVGSLESKRIRQRKEKPLEQKTFPKTFQREGKRLKETTFWQKNRRGTSNLSQGKIITPRRKVERKSFTKSEKPHAVGGGDMGRL